jgi:hypothetical protein
VTTAVVPPPSAPVEAETPVADLRDSKVLNVPDLRWLIERLLGQEDPRIRLPDDAYRHFLDDLARAVSDALGYNPGPADWTEEWLVSFYLTEDSPADGGILADPQLDPDVQDEFMAGVAARQAART